EMTDQRRESVQAGEPLGIGAEVREGVRDVLGDQAIGLLEGRHTQAVLHQAQREHFGIRESGPIVGRATPGSLMGMGLEIIVHEDVQSCQLVGYTGHGVVLRGGARLASPFPLRLHENCPLLFPTPDSGFVRTPALRWSLSGRRQPRRALVPPLIDTQSRRSPITTRTLSRFTLRLIG